MGQRKAEMLDLAAGSSTTRVTYKIPTRGMLGLRNAMLTATKGTAVINTLFSGYEPWVGDILMREQGSLVAHETGQVLHTLCFSHMPCRSTMSVCGLQACLLFSSLPSRSDSRGSSSRSSNTTQAML